MPIKDELSPHGKVVGIYQPWNPMMGQSYVMEDGTFQPMQKFANPDEAMFSDANRPRDPNGFRIMPGVQMPKWSLREKIKDTYLNQIIVKGACMPKGISSWGNLESALTTTKFKKEYTSEDFNFLLWYEVWTSDIHGKYTEEHINNLVKDRKTEIFGKPWVDVSNGDVIIRKNWSYIVQFYADFNYKYPRDTNRLDKVFMYLVYNGKVWVRMQQRTCATTDWVSGLYIGWLKKWDRLNIACAVAFTDNDVRETYCATAINIVETS